MKVKPGEKFLTPFRNEIGVYQDGTVPFCRDSDGMLWGISGHTHMGHIGVFCGTNVRNMQEVYPLKTNFKTGAAGEAFNGVKYPDGIPSRGSVWPFGLYICPKTQRFFCLFHNETGWAAGDTAYDSNGICKTPFLDSDFRHVGLMHSDDKGRTWDFDRWVLTGEQVAFTERYNPQAGSVIGQKYGVVNLGSGDFSCFVDDDYIYIFYNILKVDMFNERICNVDVYVARSRRREDGITGDFVKYYNGSFCEAGNFGKESAIAFNAWHPRVAYCPQKNIYVMASMKYIPDRKPTGFTDTMQVSFGRDLLHWDEPQDVLSDDGSAFGSHYNAIVSCESSGRPEIIGDKFYILTCHNGTDVTGFEGTLEL